LYVSTFGILAKAYRSQRSVGCPDGVYTRVDGRPKWNSVEDISDDDVATLVTKISQSVLRLLRKLGYLDKNGEVVQNPVADDVFQDSESISNERLEITSEGKVKLRLKTRWADGTTHLLFTPGEFIEKLMALIPPRKSHLVR
jgi:hypothetical protein